MDLINTNHINHHNTTISCATNLTNGLENHNEMISPVLLTKIESEQQIKLLNNNNNNNKNKYVNSFKNSNNNHTNNLVTNINNNNINSGHLN